MDGVRVVKSRLARSWVIHIDNFSDELKNCIKENLAAICYGYKRVNRNRNLYSYKHTIKQFNSRYSSKSTDIKKGMIGELLAHILIRQLIPKLKPASPFFNMEEESIRKGYDLILIDPKTDFLWITEVKAGNANKCTSDAASKALLHTAKRDLKKRLNENEVTLWDNAICAATVALKEGSIKEKVIDILEDILENTANEQMTSQKSNVILVAVLYNSLTDRVALNTVISFSNELVRENLFKNTVVFSIQKNTYTRIEQFLASEAS
jgi:hypothetical protein